MTDLLKEKDAIRDVLQQAGRLLDAEAFSDWIELFAQEAVYEVRTYSPEIGVEMEWLKLNRDELKALLEQVPEHVRDLARHLHLVSPISIEVSNEGARSLSAFAVYRTTQEGATSCYAVGHYEDTLAQKAGVWRLLARTVRLHTRVLEVGTHVPL